MAQSKWYVTVKGGGSYSSASGGRLTGGPNEVSEEVAREIAAGGYDWITVGHKPVSLAETALRGPLTLEDIYPAVQEAQAASADANQARLEPATPVDEREPLATSEAEVEAKLAEAGSAPLPVAEQAAAPEYDAEAAAENEGMPASEDEVAAALAEGEEAAAEGSEEGAAADEGEPLPSADAAAEEPAEAPEPEAAPDAPEHTCPHADCDGHGHAYASQASLDRHLKSKHGEES